MSNQWKTTTICSCLNVLLGFTLLATYVQAAEYDINVNFDTATLSDFELIESHIAAAPENQVPPQAMRRVIGAATGELEMLVQARIDDYGNLSLDDGMLVTLYDGDILMTRPTFGAEVFLRTVCYPDKDVCFVRATSIRIRTPNFVRQLILPIRGPR